jgi:hypothetical protein
MGLEIESWMLCCRVAGYADCLGHGERFDQVGSLGVRLSVYVAHFALYAFVQLVANSFLAALELGCDVAGYAETVLVFALFAQDVHGYEVRVVLLEGGYDFGVAGLAG